MRTRPLPRHGLATCHACGKQIRWTITRRGARQAVDPEPNPIGTVAARLDHQQVWRSRPVPADRSELLPLEHRFTPHAATCLAHRPPPPQQLELPAPTNVIPFRPRRPGPRQ